MSDEKISQPSFLSRLLKKYRLVILNDSTFAERFSWRVNLFSLVSISITLLLFIVVSFTSLIPKTVDALQKIEINPVNQIIILLTTVTAGIGGLIMSYLNKSKGRQLAERSEVEKYVHMVRILKRKLDELTDISKDENKKELYDKLSQVVVNELATDIEARLSQKYAKEAIQSMKSDRLYKTFETTLKRIRYEIISTTDRANLNLTIGILSTLGAIGGFIAIIYYTPETAPSLVDYFLPRIFLVLFIQVFAYFFLRLYKKGMEDIKYYQNELTNIESKMTAIQFNMASGESDKNITEIIVRQMIRNDRNSVFTSGATNQTIEMEKLNNSDGSIDKIISMMEGLRKNGSSK